MHHDVRPPLGYDSVVATPGILNGITPSSQQKHWELVVWNHNGTFAYPEFVAELAFDGEEVD